VWKQFEQQMEVVIGRRKRGDELGEREEFGRLQRESKKIKLRGPVTRDSRSFAHRSNSRPPNFLPVQEILERGTPQAEATRIVSKSGPFATKSPLL
jgi:hypothetical protein